MVSSTRLPVGFRAAGVCCGLKPDGAHDLSLLVADQPCAAAAVFTRNHFPGAPVLLGREVIRAKTLQAVVVNSKVSNVGMGAAGLEHARRMARKVATTCGISADHVLVSSTGVILQPLPIGKIEAGIDVCYAQLGDDPLPAAQGMMTTDTYPKVVTVTAGDATITVLAKGAGMLAPDMATMLVYALTDAAVDADDLDRILRNAVDQSLNMLSVDTDTSTSDTCAILATGRVAVDLQTFEKGLKQALIAVAEMLARDAEGATKLLRASVRGAQSQADARTVAKALIDSPLIKTMAYGADPNVGRVLMAIGKCSGCAIDTSAVTIAINGTTVYQHGQREDFDEAAMRQSLSGDPVDIIVQIHTGTFEATAYGCDLTEGYITENAAYYSS